MIDDVTGLSRVELRESHDANYLFFSEMQMCQKITGI